MDDLVIPHRSSTEAASHFLALAAAGEAAAALGAALVPLLADVDAVVRRRHAGWCRGTAPDLDDLKQEVHSRLLAHPPTRLLPNRSPLVVLLAWVSTVTSRLLVDHYRREGARRTTAVQLDAEPTTLDGDDHRGHLDTAAKLQIARHGSCGVSPEETVGATEEAGRLLENLDRRAPAVAALFRAMLSDPGANDEELALFLGVSINVVYKNRQRLREHVVRFRLASASSEGYGTRGCDR